MTSVATEPQKRPRQPPSPAALDRRFEAVVFDWDGTAVPDRAADASHLRELIEELCALGLDLARRSPARTSETSMVSSARGRPVPGRLFLCVNRGSEVYRADAEGLHLVERREATAEEDAALDAAAQATVEELARRGIEAEIVSQRLNRRKIDLIPEPEWPDPPKARIAELLAAVEARLAAAGLDGLREAVELADRRRAPTPASPIRG